MGALGSRLARLEAAVFDAAVRQVAVEHGMSAEETARLAADARWIAARLARLQATGLTHREAVTRIAVEDGLDPDQLLDGAERIMRGG